MTASQPETEFADHPDYLQLSAARRYLGGEIFLKDDKLWLLGCEQNGDRGQAFVGENYGLIFQPYDEPIAPAATTPKAQLKADPKRPTIGTAAELRAKKFDAIRYVVPGFVVEGCTIIAGRPKLGKSWLMLDIGIAVARGSTCLGSVQCEQGDVLYLALEDNERRMHSRIGKLMPKLIEKEWPDAFHYATEWPRQDSGGVKYIEEWLDAHPNARMVIVDVLAMFRPMQNGKANAYEQDYLAVNSLHKVASERGVAIVIVTHTKKGASESGDPFELVSGTLGLTGAADSTLVLDRDGQGCTLYGRGRDIPEIESAVTFDATTCKWRLLGEAVEVRRSDERAQILAVVGSPDQPSAASDIAEETGLKLANVRVLLGKMVKAGEVQRMAKGKYALPGEPSNHASNPAPHYNGYAGYTQPANDNDITDITDITGGEGIGQIIEAAA